MPIAVAPNFVVPRASESDAELGRKREKVLASVEDRLFIVLDDSRAGEVFEYAGAASDWSVNRDSRWANGTETAWVDGLVENSGEIMLFAEGEFVFLFAVHVMEHR